MKPDHLRRSPTQNRHLAKVIILGDDRIAIGGCVFPDSEIRRLGEPNRTNMPGIGIDVLELRDEPKRQVLVYIEASLNASRGELSFPISCEGKASPKVLDRQIRKIVNDFRFRHSGRQILKHVVDRNSKVANTRFPAPLLRVD